MDAPDNRTLFVIYPDADHDVFNVYGTHYAIDGDDALYVYSFNEVVACFAPGKWLAIMPYGSAVKVAEVE